MYIFNNNPADSYSYYIHTQNKRNVNLVSVCEKHDLGICFDSAVKIGKHIDNKIKKANSIADLIRRTFQFLDIHAYMLLDKALVRS